MMKAGFYFIISGLLPGYIFAAELPVPDYKSIAEGVWYGMVKQEDPPLSYHIIKVDRSKKDLSIRPIRPREDETLGQLAARMDTEKLPLLGAITGDYFHYVREYNVVIPWGILADEGKLLFSPDGKSALCENADGGFHISVPTMTARVRNSPDSTGIRVAAVNRPTELEGTDCGIYNSTWGAFAPPEFSEGFAVTVIGDRDFPLSRTIRGTVSGMSRLPVRAPIPADGFIMIMGKLPSSDQLDLKLGSPVIVNIEASPSLENAIGGGPRILRDGKVSIELNRENFGAGISFYIKNSRHPRSAVGIGQEGRFLFLVVVEGRSDESRGMNMPELARLLLALGAAEGMAFDGGRSVSMYVDGKDVVKGDRQMADALGVFQIKK